MKRGKNWGFTEVDPEPQHNEAMTIEIFRPIMFLTYFHRSVGGITPLAISEILYCCTLVQNVKTPNEKRITKQKLFYNWTIK